MAPHSHAGGSHLGWLCAAMRGDARRFVIRAIAREWYKRVRTAGA